MRYVFVLVAILGMCAAGCTRHHSVPRTPQSFVGKQVTLHLRDGASVLAQATSTTNGVVWYTDSGEPLAPQQIGSVEITHPGRGVLQGLGLGLLLGVTAGVTTGYISGDDTGDRLFQFTADEKAVIAGTVLGAVGGLVGLVVGGIRGSHDRYSLESGSGSAVPRVSVAPVSGGTAAALSWAF